MEAQRLGRGNHSASAASALAGPAKPEPERRFGLHFWMPLVFKVALSATLMASGFRALSDDDYARLTIAQRFAEAPRLDPTGTSWLPLPFYLYGGAFAVTGTERSWLVGRGLAILIGAVSVGLLWCAARNLGFGRLAATVGALLGAVFPYSAYLGAALVPESLSAALAVFGASTLAKPCHQRAWGAAALALATAQRYEVWAVAGVFVVICVGESLVQRERRALLAAAIGASFMLAWLAHGIARHHDALFFISRVRAYRAALGISESWYEPWLRTPRALFTGAPGLMAMLALFAAPVLWLERSRYSTAALARFLVATGAVVLLSFLGDVRGSAPTHHGERALLAAWFAAALLIGYSVELQRTTVQGSARARLQKAWLGLSATAGICLIAYEYPALARSFVDRSAELDIGVRARALGVPRLAIDSPDFGYFAIQAGYARPASTRVLDDHDPRQPHPKDELTRAPADLARSLASDGFSWIVLPATRRPLSRALGHAREGNGRFWLIELAPP